MSGPDIEMVDTMDEPPHPLIHLYQTANGKDEFIGTTRDTLYAVRWADGSLMYPRYAVMVTDGDVPIPPKVYRNGCWTERS